MYCKFSNSIFITIIILLFLVSNNKMKSKVNYTKVDSTLAGTVLYEPKEYQIDFNGDGTMEFFLSHGNQGIDEIFYVWEIYSGINGNSNEVLVINDRSAVMLGDDEVINENLSVWRDSYNGMSTIAMYFEGDWLGAGYKFAALRFKINGRYHYGWVRLSVPANSSNIAIKDMAYEDNPEQSIIAEEPGTEVAEENDKNIPLIKINDRTLTIESEKDYDCGIYNITGNKIFSFSLMNNTREINLEKFNFGIYLLLFKSGDEIITKKIILD